MSKTIPIHTLKDINKIGIEIKRIAAIAHIEKDVLGVHRDDHYLFFYQQTGRSEMMLDFNEISNTGECLFFILPGQVHQVKGIFNCTGWFLAVAPEYVKEDYRTVFEELTITQQRITPNNEIAYQLHQALFLLEKICSSSDDLKFQEQIIRSLIDTCLAFYASAYSTTNRAQLQLLRPVIISRDFKKLLRKNFKEIKSPTDYANLLNISSSYLNEVVKQTTGFSVSYWIHQEVMMEAKRLLYYTKNSIKEIANVLGFTDHAYFSRLFSKVTGQSPIQFRGHYRE